MVHTLIARMIGLEAERESEREREGVMGQEVVQEEGVGGRYY